MRSSPRTAVSLCGVDSLLSWLVALGLLYLSACSLVEAMPGYASTSVLNITFSGAGVGWPTSTSALAPATNAVTSAVCDQLPPTVAACSAFLISVSTDVIAVQMSVDTDIASNASSVYETLQGWSQNAGSPPTSSIQTAAQSALGGSLSTLAYQSGFYTMPCRAEGVYSFLPVCTTAEAQPNTTFYVRRGSGSSGDAASAVTTHICALQSSCADAVVTVTEPSGNEAFAKVTITGAAMALEAILAYVSDVRAAARNSQSDVARIEMRSGSMTASLFSINETRRYAVPYPVTLQCAPATGMWAVALIAIVPIALIIFRYIWYRGRKHAKKVGRQRVIEDEQRIMQGYTRGASAVAAGTGADPPPGVDASAYMNSRPQAQTAPVGGGASAAAPAANAQEGAAASQDQQWVMDEQGNYYLMSAEDAVSPDVEAVEMEQVDPTENSISYQTYVDPSTGDVYQYVVDPQAAEDVAQGEQAQADPNSGTGGAEAAPQEAYEEVPIDDAYTNGDATAAGGQASPQYVQYVDPNSGETYYYDASAAQDAATSRV